MTVTTIRSCKRGDQIGLVTSQSLPFLVYFQVYHEWQFGHTDLVYEEVWTCEAPAIGSWCQWKDTGTHNGSGEVRNVG